MIKKIGIIRCQQTEDMCPGTTCIKNAISGNLGFSPLIDDNEETKFEFIGFVSCGGCPGKRSVPRIKEMIRRGANTIVFGACISQGNPIGIPCPHFRKIKEAVKLLVNKEIEIIDKTH